jgi:hypothetical protein
LAEASPNRRTLVPDARTKLSAEKTSASKKRRTTVKIIGKVGVSFVLVGGLALAVHVRGGRAQFVPVAQAADSQDNSSDEACSLDTLRGSFGVTTTGFIVAFGPVGPVADVGVITFDGNGGVSQTTTVSLNGIIIPSRTSSGSYVVNSDCTGSQSLQLPPPAGASNSNFVIVDHGRELRLINTGNGRVLAGNAKRQ